jgi:ATP-binding cassette subfamily B protein
MRLLGFLRGYRRSVALSVLLAALAMAATVAIPWLTGRAVDALARGDRGELRLLAGAIVVAALLRLVVSAARRVVAGRVAGGIEVDLRAAIYAHLQALELGFFANRQTGELMSRARQSTCRACGTSSAGA